MTSSDVLPQVSIVIPTKDHKDLLKKCIDGLLLKTNYPLTSIEIIVVNNRSEQADTVKYLKEISLLNFVKVLDYNLPFNFSAITNFAVDQASGDMICLLNNDIEVLSSDWLGEMVRYAKRSYIGCVGAKLYYTDGTIQHAGVVLGINGVAGHVYKKLPHDAAGYDSHLLSARYYSAVTAACLLVRKSVFTQAGGFDEKLAVAYNDVDFCLKVGNLGYKHLWTPRAELYHHESMTRDGHRQRSWLQQRRFKKEVKYMKKKWGEQLYNDPAWHEEWPLTETWDGVLSKCH